MTDPYIGLIDGLRYITHVPGADRVIQQFPELAQYAKGDVGNTPLDQALRNAATAARYLGTSSGLDAFWRELGKYSTGTLKMSPMMVMPNLNDPKILEMMPTILKNLFGSGGQG